VLGTALEKLTGKDTYDALDSELAKPVGMQDFDRAKQKKIPIAVSVHPEYAMSISTRDMARLGLLMARTGNWNGKQLVPADWVRATTTLITPFDEINPTGMRIRRAAGSLGLRHVVAGMGRPGFSRQHLR
jgi:CubicO group peptidase (beta-lactamase class C family)